MTYFNETFTDGYRIRSKTDIGYLLSREKDQFSGLEYSSYKHVFFSRISLIALIVEFLYGLKVDWRRILV